MTKIKEYTASKLYNYGLFLLSKREYSEKQIRDKMLTKTENNELVQQAILKLKEYGYLSDTRKAQSIIRSYQQKENGHKIIQRLKLAGIEVPTIEENYEKSTVEEQIEKCVNLLDKKYKYFDSEKQDRYIRFLMNKGFEYSAVKKALESFRNNEH